jgi:hypothetical protein
MNVKVYVCAVLIASTNLGTTLVAQSGPSIEKSPEVVPYKPGKNAKLVPIAACPSDFSAQPEPGVVYGMEPGITAPKPTRMTTVELTKQGRDAYKHGLFKDPNDVVSRISIIIGTDGVTKSPCLVRGAGFDLDELAGNAALQWRFKPALKDGTPVEMRTTLEFRYETH